MHAAHGPSIHACLLPGGRHSPSIARLVEAGRERSSLVL